MAIEIDFKKIAADSITLAKTEVGNAWKKLKPYAEHEFTQFAENTVFLAKLRIEGTIDDDELRTRLSIQKLALTNVLLAIKGIGLVTAQSVVNGVIDIVSGAVKNALQLILPIPI